MLGRKGNHQGADQVEGHHYCPMLPDDLANATANYRDKTHPDYKNLAVFKARIKARTIYMMRNKSASKPGERRQLQCPAAGHHPLVKCALKPKSVDLVLTTKQPDGTVADSRPDVIIREERLKNGEVDTCCSQETFTLQAADGLKYRQAEQYGLDKHSAIHQPYATARKASTTSAKTTSTKPPPASAASAASPPSASTKP